MRIEWLKEMTAEFAMQAAYAKTDSGPVLCKIGHIEWFVRVRGGDTTQPDDVIEARPTVGQSGLNIWQVFAQQGR